jgi:cell filamentation protein, protein adenylyltransferase
MKKGDRYDVSGLLEAQFEPGSRRRVLRNRLGIRRMHEMQGAESQALIAAQEQLVESFSVDHRFTAQDICRMHRIWLGEIYGWAGEYRAVNISKGDFHFAAAAQVPRLMQELQRGALARYTPCRPAVASEVARAIGIVHAELVLIHPFREGNGRCARLLALLMGLQAGLPPLDFSALSGKGMPTYIAAIHAALGRDYDPIARVFSETIRRTLRRYAGSRPT